MESPRGPPVNVYVTHDAEECRRAVQNEVVLGEKRSHTDHSTPRT